MLYETSAAILFCTRVFFQKRSYVLVIFKMSQYTSEKDSTFLQRSALSTQNKLLLYNQVLKPVGTYGIQLWGCTKPSNIAIIQRFQNKVLRAIVNALWYVRNADLHRDLKMEMVTAEIKRFARKHEERLHRHDNVEAIELLDNSALLRRLNRIKPFELAN